jgi:ribonuclease I
LTIHGLWPGLINGDTVIGCENPNGEIPKIDFKGHKALSKKMNEFWSSINERYCFNLWRYQYKIHGQCLFFGEPLVYFQKAIDLYDKFQLNFLLDDIITVLKKLDTTMVRDCRHNTSLKEYTVKVLDVANAITSRRKNIYFQISCIVIDQLAYLHEIKFIFDTGYKSLDVFLPNSCYNKETLIILYKPK